MSNATVVGAGLAGCEAAWQLARRGVDVTLIEMKPVKYSPAHKMPGFAELVCSNSLGAARLDTAPGLLKEELRRLGSLVISAADRVSTPAGGALAVDRRMFSEEITSRIKAEKNISIVNEEARRIPDGDCVIVATGPLTSGELYDDIARVCGGLEFIEFFDAVAPIISADSIDMGKAYVKSRYDRGSPDYINCPMSKEEYLAFLTELKSAREAPVHGFEDSKVFEGCMPVEVLARRGEDALRYGPMKPVGLRDPRTGKTPYAVVQLRRDDIGGTCLNMVGFQTHLAFPEQKRVFSMIPALASAEYLRLGVMHRNTFIRSPLLLDSNYMLKSRPGLYFAGQITGVEGYAESVSSGFAAGVSAYCRLAGMKPPVFPAETAIGALARYISEPSRGEFQPMGINFGIIPPLDYKLAKKDRKMAQAARALDAVAAVRHTLSMPEVIHEDNY